MNKKDTAQTGQALLIGVAMVLGVLIGLMFNLRGTRQQDDSSLSGKMEEVMQLVKRNYVDPVDTDSLSDRLLGVMLSELDPHSTYLSATATAKADELMRGNFEGTGIVLHREGDTTYVGQIMQGGPAEGHGLLPGDMITAVDGRPIAGLPSDTVVSLIRGPRGTSVELTVMRWGEHDARHFTIRRGVVDHESVVYDGMIDDTTGYILLSSFTATSHQEFRQALQRLLGQGMKHLVFDMRGNGGGSLTAATGIAGELLEQGSMIVYMEGEHTRRRNMRARGHGLYTTGGLTIMIDESSASASEIVSGAVQDNDRGRIVGRRSFGKGLVQTEYELSDGSAVLLTTARYYTPSGRCIQRPYDDGTEEYYRTYMQNLIDEEYADSSLASEADTTRYYTTSGRVVYGGGGITPDVILPYRKDKAFVYYNQLASRLLMMRTAFDYTRRHAQELLKRYPTADSYYNQFEVSHTMIEELARRAEKEGIERNEQSLGTLRPLIENNIKAYIGQSLYGSREYYRIRLLADEDIEKTRHL